MFLVMSSITLLVAPLLTLENLEISSEPETVLEEDIIPSKNGYKYLSNTKMQK